MLLFPERGSHGKLVQNICKVMAAATGSLPAVNDLLFGTAASQIRQAHCSSLPRTSYYWYKNLLPMAWSLFSVSCFSSLFAKRESLHITSYSATNELVAKDQKLSMYMCADARLSGEQGTREAENFRGSKSFRSPLCTAWDFKFVIMVTNSKQEVSVEHPQF